MHPQNSVIIVGGNIPGLSLHTSPPTCKRISLRLVCFSIPLPQKVLSEEEYIQCHLSWVKIFTVYRSNDPKFLTAEAQVAFQMG